MTYEEAISVLTKDRALCLFNPWTGEQSPLNEDCRMSAEAMGLAIDALKKLRDDAIPNDMDNYCSVCGQAIDWR